MNLAKQLPFIFPNNVAVCSFNGVKCKSCKGTLTTDRIDADIMQWGAHIIVIKGVGTCLVCHHVTNVEVKIRDDKSVYDNKKAVWITAKTGSRQEFRKIFTNIVESMVELFSILMIVALAWTILFVSAHFMVQKTERKTVTYLGQIYYVTGAMGNSFYKAEPVGGGRETLIPVSEVRKVKVSDLEKIDGNKSV